MNVIVFRFCGGARDGQTIRSDQPLEGQKEVDTFWELSWNGTVGRRFDVPALGSPTYQRYQVRSKYEVGDEVHVTCEHIG